MFPHVDLFVKLNSDPEVMRFILGRGASEAETRQEWSQRMGPQTDAARGLGYWSGFTVGGTFLGWWSASAFREDDRRAGLGYRLVRSSWGLGYATEGARLMLEQAEHAPSVEKVVASTMAVNLRSRRVLEKLGMNPSTPPTNSGQTRCRDRRRERSSTRSAFASVDEPPDEWDRSMTPERPSDFGPGVGPRGVARRQDRRDVALVELTSPSVGEDAAHPCRDALIVRTRLSCLAVPTRWRKRIVQRYAVARGSLRAMCQLLSESKPSPQGAHRPSPLRGLVPLGGVGVAEGEVCPRNVVPALRDRQRALEVGQRPEFRS